MDVAFLLWCQSSRPMSHDIAVLYGEWSFLSPHDGTVSCSPTHQPPKCEICSSINVSVMLRQRSSRAGFLIFFITLWAYSFTSIFMKIYVTIMVKIMDRIISIGLPMTFSRVRETVEPMKAPAIVMMIFPEKKTMKNLIGLYPMSPRGTTTGSSGTGEIAARKRMMASILPFFF